MARKPPAFAKPATAGKGRSSIETRNRAGRNRALRAGAPYPEEVAPPALRPGQAPTAARAPEPAVGAAFAEDPDPTDRGLPPARTGGLPPVSTTGRGTKVTIRAGAAAVETTLEDMQAATDRLAGGTRHNLGGDAGERLRRFVERIESLEKDKVTIKWDIHEVFAEAKVDGFDAPAMREVIRERRLDKAERDGREALRDLYRHALGMLDGTPLGEAALARAAE